MAEVGIVHQSVLPGERVDPVFYRECGFVLLICWTGYQDRYSSGCFVRVSRLKQQNRPIISPARAMLLVIMAMSSVVMVQVYLLCGLKASWWLIFAIYPALSPPVTNLFGYLFTAKHSKK